MTFTIGPDEIAKRKKNILLGLGFSVGLTALIGYANGVDSMKYNDILLGSVVFFLVFANIINAFRFFQWLKQIPTHRIQMSNGALHFYKGSAVSTLKPDNIAKLKLRKKNGSLITITVTLNIGNKIRLEGYNDMEGLLAAFQQVAPKDLLIEDG